MEPKHQKNKNKKIAAPEEGGTGGTLHHGLHGPVEGNGPPINLSFLCYDELAGRCGRAAVYPARTDCWNVSVRFFFFFWQETLTLVHRLNRTSRFVPSRLEVTTANPTANRRCASREGRKRRDDDGSRRHVTPSLDVEQALRTAAEGLIERTGDDDDVGKGAGGGGGGGRGSSRIKHC